MEKKEKKKIRNHIGALQASLSWKLHSGQNPDSLKTKIKELKQKLK